MRSTLIVSILAGLAFAASGCANSDVKVVGDRPADVYVNRKPDTIRGLLKDVLKDAVGIDTPVKYVGRTVKDPSGSYVLLYEFEDHPENGAEIQVLAQDGRVWDYKVAFDDRGEHAIVYYPKFVAGRATEGKRPDEHEDVGVNVIDDNDSD